MDFVRTWQKRFSKRPTGPANYCRFLILRAKGRGTMYRRSIIIVRYTRRYDRYVRIDEPRPSEPWNPIADAWKRVNWNRTEEDRRGSIAVPRSPSTAIDKILTNGISWRGCVRPSTKFLAREISGLHGRRVSVTGIVERSLKKNHFCVTVKQCQNSRNDQFTMWFILQRRFLSV